MQMHKYTLDVYLQYKILVTLVENIIMEGTKIKLNKCMTTQRRNVFI